MAARNAHSVLPSSNAKRTAALRVTARGSNLRRVAGNRTFPQRLATRSRRLGLPSMLSFVRRRSQVLEPAPVHQHLHGAREGGPGEQAHHGQGHRVGGAHLDADAAADRVVGAGVGVEPARDHPDEEGRGGGVVEQADGGAGAPAGARSPTPRACSRPRIGAVSACVSGTPKRAGPMIATVSSIAAALAPKPSRAPRRSATRARATPPASAIQKPPVGAARAARKETTPDVRRPDRVGRGGGPGRARPWVVVGRASPWARP